MATQQKIICLFILVFVIGAYFIPGTALQLGAVVGLSLLGFHEWIDFKKNEQVKEFRKELETLKTRVNDLITHKHLRG